MSFYALDFVFNGISSQTYSLKISSDDSGEESTMASGDLKLYTEKLFRRTDEFLYGVSLEPVLEFDVKFMTHSSELTAPDWQLISRWLFGKKTYQKLQIIQPDMQEVIYDCFLLAPKMIRSGNKIVGLNATVHCKDMWGKTSIKNFTYDYPSSAFNETIYHNNLSDYTGYTYPTLYITFDSFGGDFTWTNITDNSRVYTLDNLQANEVITLDNNLQIISSSTALNRLSNFNKKFFRLLPGKNQILLNGNVSQFKISYPLAKMVGG